MLAGSADGFPTLEITLPTLETVAATLPSDSEFRSIHRGNSIEFKSLLFNLRALFHGQWILGDCDLPPPDQRDCASRSALYEACGGGL